jgi:hypothetical protein
VPDRKLRIRAFLDAYGGMPEFDVVEAMAARAQSTIDQERELARLGVEPQRTWVEERDLEDQAEEVRWLRGNRHLLA